MLWEQDIQCYGKKTLLAIAIHYYGKTSSDSQNVLHIVMRIKRQEEASPHHRNSYSCSFSHSRTIIFLTQRSAIQQNISQM